MKWNEMDEMGVDKNGGMKFEVGENGRNPAKNLPRPRFVHHETYEAARYCIMLIIVAYLE